MFGCEYSDTEYIANGRFLDSPSDRTQLMVMPGWVGFMLGIAVVRSERWSASEVVSPFTEAQVGLLAANGAMMEQTVNNLKPGPARDCTNDRARVSGCIYRFRIVAVPRPGYPPGTLSAFLDSSLIMTVNFANARLRSNDYGPYEVRPSAATHKIQIRIDGPADTGALLGLVSLRDR